jgi:hypothetical protein
MKTIVELTREAGFAVGLGSPALEKFERLIAMARADERMSFYGQDKPVECAEGCPPNQICDYCQVVAPVKAMILDEREACAKLCDDIDDSHWGCEVKASWCSREIRARGETK